MTIGVCPACEQDITVNRPEEGQKITCPKCGDELEVVGVNPLELDWHYEDDEWDDDDDWDDDDWDDDDDDEDWEDNDEED